MKRAIIIGSGLGGLSTAVILAKYGYRVTLLEQSAQIGGALQCFRRSGVSFETGMHYIGSAGRGEIIDSLFKYLGILESISLQELDPSGYDIIALGGSRSSSRYPFAKGREGFIERLCSFNRSWRDSLMRYMQAVESVAASSSIRNIAGEGALVESGVKYQTLSMDSVLEELVDDPLLRDILAGTQSLYSAVAGRTPFALHAFIMDFYNKGAYRIKGGSSTIATALAERLKAMGGEIVTSAKAQKILFNSSGAEGVICGNGERYYGDLIISTIHPAAFAELIEECQLLRPIYKSRLRSFRNTSGGFTLYIKFKRGKMPYMNHNLFGYTGESPWGCQFYNSSNWPLGYLYTHSVPTNGGGYAESGEIITYMNFADVERWQGLPVGRRGAKYEDFKRRCAERLIAAVERDVPGLADCIEAYWSSTPLTYLDYTSTAEGSMYGVAKEIDSTASRVSFRTKVPNLLLAGQSVNSHGLLGVLVGTLITCSHIVGNNRIYNNLKEYMEE